MFCASCRKSSSRRNESERCSITAGRSTIWRKAARFSVFSANSSSRPRSRRISPCAVGRCTLTTTRSPFSSVERCTWPIVPAASGDGSIDSKTSSQGTPSSSSITETTSASVSGGTSSWSLASSATNSGGIRSGRVERIWPSLAKVGPSSSSASRRLAARAWSDSSPPTCSRKPYLAMTVPMRTARPRRWSPTSVTGGTSPSCAARPAGRC